MCVTLRRGNTLNVKMTLNYIKIIKLFYIILWENDLAGFYYINGKNIVIFFVLFLFLVTICLIFL